jgi:hypothetical protein
MLLLGTNVQEERIASIIRVTRIGKLGTTLEVPSHPDDGDTAFLRNLGSYKSQTKSHPEESILQSYPNLTT